MAGLEETLALDYSDALSGVDELEGRLTGAARTAEAALSDAFTNALGDAESFADLAGEALARSLAGGAQAGLDQAVGQIADTDAQLAVDAVVDTAQVDSAFDDLEPPQLDIAVDGQALDDVAQQIDQLAGEDIDVDVTVDDSELQSVGAELDGLSGSTIDTAVTVGGDDLTEVEDQLSLFAAVPDPELAVLVDMSEVDAAAVEIEQLSQPVQVDVGVAGQEGLTQLSDQQLPDVAAGADEATGALSAVSFGAATATGGLSGLSSAGSRLIPVWGQVAIAGAGIAAATKSVFDSAVAVDAANRRLNTAYGDQVEELQDLRAVQPDLSGQVATLKELTLATGSSGAGLKTQIANYAELGKQSGATTEQLVETGRQFGLLANYVAAARPELGTADQIAGQLSLTLARGGPRAAKFGIDIGNSAAIAEAAAEKYGKPVSELTAWEKSTTGLGIALDNLGPKLSSTLDANLENPVVKLRALDRELRGVLATAGEPLLDPLLNALQTLQPVVLSTATLFGTFVGATIPAIVTGLEPVLDILAAVAELLARLPAPAIAAAAAFVGISKGAGALLPLILRIGPGLKSIAERLGALGTAAKFDAVVAQFRGADKAVANLTARTVAAEAANKAYTAALVTQAVEGNAAATVAIKAHTAAVEADSAVLAANAEVNAATLRVKAAEAAAVDGQVRNEAELIAAREAQTAALANLSGAEQRAVVARAESTAASELAVASAQSNAAELAALSAATQTNAAATASAAGTVTAAAGAAGGATALIGPLSILLGVGAAAWALWGSSSKDASEDVADAQTAIEDYTSALGLTNTELANLDASNARAQFRAASEAADDFFAALEEADLAETFNDLNLNVATAGEAINGSEAQLQSFRRELVRTGAVRFTFTTGGATQEIDETSEAYQTLLDQYLETGEVQTTAIASNGRYEASIDGIGRAFEEKVKAAAEAREAILAEAEAEVEAGNAADVNAIAQLAATGNLSQMSDEAEIAARVLLEQSDAQQQAADTATAFEVAAGGATDATALLIEAAQRAAEAFAAGEAINTSDLGAARALAASDAFDDLPPEVQDSVTALLDFADSEIDAANNAGELISSLGEVATSLVELQEELDQAIGKFDELRGAQGRFNATQRDIASGIRGVDDQVAELGPSLDSNGAAFDAAAISAANYQDYLDLLSDEQRKFIDDAKVPDGTNEDGTVKERGLNDAEKAEAVRRAIVGSADAMARANDSAKDNADELLDYFDTVTGKIAEAGQDAIANGENVEEVNKRVAGQVQQFRDAAIAAGVAEGAIDEYLASVGLNPITGFAQDQLDTSGVTNAIDDLERLRTVVNLLPTDIRLAIEAETDPEEQRKLIEEGLNSLGPAFAVQVDTYLAATTPEEAAAALATIQQTVDRLQIVKVALGLEVDPNADPATQLQQIQEQIADKTAGAQVAIQTYLQAPDPVAAQFALDTIVNRAAAAQAVVRVSPQFSEEDAAQAVLDITKFNNDPANTVKLPVTVETAALVAAVNAGYTDQLEAIDVRTDIPESEKQKLRDELEKKRTAELEVIANTGQASKDVDALTAEAQTQEVNVDVKVPDWAKWIVGFPGAKPPATVGVQVNPTTGGGSGSGGKPTRGPAAALIENIGGFIGGLFGQRGGTTVVDAYATGGARVDPRVLRKLQRERAGLDRIGEGDARPGRYGPGANVVAFAESGSSGEYLISRSVTDRDRNQELVRTAAADLGVDLGPSVAAVAAPAPVVNVTSTVDPALVAALEQVAARPSGPRRAITLEQGAVQVIDRSGQPERTAAMTVDELNTESFLRGDV